MTTGMINQINSLAKLTNIVNATNQTTASTDFSEVLKANSVKNNDAEVKSTKTSENAKSDKKDLNLETSGKRSEETEISDDSLDNVNKDNLSETEEAVETKEIPEEVLEAVAQALTAIADILNVDVQTVEVAIDELGLTDVAVLDESKLQDITLAINGVEDPVQLMTDESLYSDVKAVTEAVTEIVEEIDLPKEDVKDIITSFENQIQEAENLGNEIELKPVDEKAGKDDAGNDSQAGMNWTEGLVDHLKEAVSEITTEAETQTFATDMNEIYEQVSESLKLNMTQDVTEMEINLHPASLGNVKIQVAAKDGVITANFTTQNEQVKAAIETQIIQLKESMNEQGIKVEAIEVNVSAHAFEENLSKEGDSSNSGEAQNSKKRRSINLNEIDEIDDNINVEDEIRIAREMMMHNGTTVDYMA